VHGQVDDDSKAKIAQGSLDSKPMTYFKVHSYKYSLSAVIGDELKLYQRQPINIGL